MGKDLAELFSFLEDSIRRDFENFNLLSFTICGSGRRNFNIAGELESALLACSTNERIEYLEIAVEHLVRRKTETSIKVLDPDFALEEVRVRLVKGIKMKESSRVLLRELSLDCKHFQIDLSSYLVRNSKKDSKIYILETMVAQQPASIRFVLEEPSLLKEQELAKLKSLIFQTMVESIFQKGQVHQEIKLSKKGKEPANESPTPPMQTEDHPSQQKQSLIEELVGHEVDPNFNEELYDYMERREMENAAPPTTSPLVSKLHKNRVPILLGSCYQLNELNSYYDFTPEATLDNTVIYYSRHRDVFRLETTLSFTKNQVIKHLCEIQHEKLWNSTVNESQIKWNITTENSAIVYRKQKSDSEWFKERDFLFLRHLFLIDNSAFIIDRSIEHPYFIPFQTIHRAQLFFSLCRLD